MPIRPENKDRYPKDWKTIRAQILERAQNCCEDCGVPNGEWIVRTEDGWEITDMIWAGVKIVLTIAHLDHTPENSSDENLKAWCQRCHNRYDAPMRRRGIKERAKTQRAVGDLFEGQK